MTASPNRSVAGGSARSSSSRMAWRSPCLRPSHCFACSSWFGWGGWGRSRIFDQWTGKDISVTDGGWIIYFGVYGWFGYLCFFGLLAAALFQAHRVMDKQVTPANILRGGVALLLTVYVINS